MRIIYSSGFIFITNMLLLYENQPLLGSFGLLAALCLFIILVTLWDRDFWRDQTKLKAKGFRSKLSALKKRLFYADEEHIIELIPELPRNDELPSVGDMASLLVKALPASDRSQAYTLLVTQLLPKKLARLPTFFERRRLLEAMYKGLASALQQSSPNERLNVLRAILCECEISELSSDSTMLAMARYMHQHPDATPKRKTYWLDFEELASFTAMSIPELEDKASQVWEQSDKWDKSAQKNHPDIWEQYKLRPFEIKVNLESAYSGSFHVAMGNFASFLSLVGAEFERIRLSNG